MKWFKSILIGFFILVCLLIVAVIAAIQYLPETDLIKTAVTDQLRKVTGNDISIASIKVIPSFPDIIRLQATEITTTSGTGEKLISIHRLVLTPSLAPLLDREISIKSVVIEGLQAKLSRELGGDIQSGFIPVPLSTGNQGKTPDGSAPRQETSPASKTMGMRWSIESVRLTDGRIDFVDKQLDPGGKAAVSLTNLDVALIQKKRSDYFGMEIKGNLGKNKAEEGSFEIKGRVGLTSDLSGLKDVSATISGTSVSLEPFRPYIPSLQGSAVQLVLTDVRCKLGLKKGEPASFSMDTHVKAASTESATVKVQAEGLIAQDFTGLEQIILFAETERFPLSVVKDYIPRTIPCNPDKGFFTAQIRGSKEKDKELGFTGTAELHQISPTGNLAAIAGEMTLKSQFKLEDRKLTVENLEASGAQRIASIKGIVSDPFSPNPAMDLKVSVSAQPQWIKAFGARFPDDFKMTGPVSIQGRLHGTPSLLAVDVQGDLTGTTVLHNPYLEKKAGEKAGFSVKGEFGAGREAGGKKASANARIRMELPSVYLRIKPETAWIKDCALSFDAGATIRGKLLDLKDVVCTLKRQNKPKEIATIVGNIDGLGSSHPSIKGTAHASINHETLELIREELPSNMALSGESRPKVFFSGTPDACNWTLDMPLTGLGIEMEKNFHKPPGMAGVLKGSGRWNKEGIHLEKANFSLPGVSATAHGMLMDRKGKPGEVKLDLKQSDLKDIAKVVPAMADLRLSGPVEADAVFKPSSKGMVPRISMQLVSVGYAPEKAGWSIGKLRGAITVTGETLNAPALTGQVRGMVEAPLKLKLTLDKISAVKDSSGKLSLEIGKGRIKADRLRNILNQTRLLIGTILNPDVLKEKASEFQELEFVKGDFDIKSGTAQTSNLQLKSPDFSLGAIGNLRLNDLSLDALVALHTVLSADRSLGKIPEVRKAVKKYEGLLKITGLDKELKRIGIDTDTTQEGQNAQEPVKTPVKVIVKLTGTASSPKVQPVLEATLAKETVERLKSLTDSPERH